MLENCVDLHVHSTFSDGTLTPTELVSLANQLSLRAIALTDHDCTDGITEALEAANDNGNALEIVPGVELSTEYNSQEVHIVGLYIDPENTKLNHALKDFQTSRDTRNLEIIKKLQNNGFHITMEALLADNPDAVITRANIARFLVDHGEIGSINHAFDRYLGDDCCCYVPRHKITPMEACQLITGAGGVAILAHPVLYHMKELALHQLIEEAMPHGLKGLEVYYSTYHKDQELAMKKIADAHQLLYSGGSDFHGDNKPYIHLGSGKGTLHIPYSICEKIKNTCQ